MGLTLPNAAPTDFQLLESMLWTPAAGYFLWERHLSRLAAAAAFFGFTINAEAIAAQAATYVRGFPALPHKVRLLVDRSGHCQWDAAALAGPTAPEPRQVGLMIEPFDTSSPFFRFKTTHRPHYDQALAACPACDDVLLCNLRGQLTESCRANLVLERAGALLTPPLTCGLLAGTFRAELLARGEIQEAVLYPADLHKSERLFLINSVRKWMPIALAV